VEPLNEGLKRFGIGRLVAIFGVAAAVAGLLLAITLHVGNKPMSLLYANLDLKEAGEITAQLDQGGIKYEVKGDGSTIMVDREKVSTARLLLANKGLPSSGSVGYEIFENAPALGQTEFVQNLNNQRALEGELARDIRTIRGISSARVRLVMPKRELFAEEAQQPTASVILGIGGSGLTADQVNAIRHYVAGAVPNLKSDNVTVMDDRNRLLAAGGSDQSSLNGSGAQRREEIEESLRKRVKDIVEGVVGPGAARVTVTADINLASVTKESREYNPEGQVVRSTKTSTGTDRSTDPQSNGGVTAGANIPGGQQAPGISTASTQSDQNEEITNYEISQTTTTEVKAPGEVKRLAVSVAVDDIVIPSKDGKGPDTYQKRSPEDMQKIEELVKAAVGFTDVTATDPNGRKDEVKVTNIRFNHVTGDAFGGTEAKAPMLDFDKNDIMRAAEMLVLFAVAVLSIFFVAKPLLSFIGGTGSSGAAGAGATGAGMGMGQASLAGAAAASAGIGYQGDATGMDPASSGIDIARIEGQVKASSVKKISDFVDRHPEESVAILRSWLHDS
jgi:flagellar M-ring protein FliF